MSLIEEVKKLAEHKCVSPRDGFVLGIDYYIEKHQFDELIKLISSYKANRAETLVMPKIKRVRIVKRSFRGDGWFDKMLGQLIEVCETDKKTLNKYNPDNRPMYILAEDYLKASEPPKTYKKGIRVIRQEYCEDVI